MPDALPEPVYDCRRVSLRLSLAALLLQVLDTCPDGSSLSQALDTLAAQVLPLQLEALTAELPLA